MTYEVWQGFAVNDAGDVLDGATVTVTLAGTATGVTLFEDKDGAINLSNPFTTDATGLVRFYSAPEFVDIVATKGADTIEFMNVRIGLPDAIQTVATLSELLALTGMTTDDVREVIGVGLFQYNGSSWVPVNTLRTPKMYYGEGDGAVDDSVSVNSTIDSGTPFVVLPDDEVYLAPTYSNIYGKEFRGKGEIVRTATGGLERINGYTDDYQRVSRQENLAAWYKHVYDQSTAPTRQLRIVFSGDSTTAGSGTTAGYTIPELVLAGITSRGLQTPYNIASLNHGQSGAHTGQWETTHVHTDVAANPDLLVLRWGINDPGWLKNGTTPPLDAGQDYPNRRDIVDYITSLRNGLATVRASKPFSTTSILLMMPNSTYDIPNGRDARWYEQLRGALIQAAKDYQCGFIDTYAIMQDSKYLANVMMDDPYADGRGIHPDDKMNSVIAGHIVDLVAPEGMRYNLASNKFFNLGGAALLPTEPLLPSAYSAALYMVRATPANGWPLDGTAITFRSVDETVLQILYPYKDADRGQLKYRQGRAASLGGEPENWSQWYTVVTDGGFSNVNPAVGYSLPGTGQMRVSFSGTQATFDGYITKDSPAIVAANTTFATLGVGFAPTHEAALGTANVYDGANWEQVPCLFDPAGNIKTLKATTLSVSRFYVSCVFDNRTTA